MPKYSHKSKRHINKVGGFVVEQQSQLQQPQTNLSQATDDLSACITALKNKGQPKIAKMIEVIKKNIDNGNFKKGSFNLTQMINTLKTSGGKTKRKSRRKSVRKSVRKSRRKSVRKSVRKSRRKSRRKSVRKSVRKSRRKSRRKSVRK